MKTGIITYHRAHNYGAVLQCYALQEILKGMGHNVIIIDYRQPFIEKLYRPSKRKQIFKNILHPRALINLRKKFIKQNSTKHLFDNFRNNLLNISDICTNSSLPKCDIYIIGSDQMWSIDCVGNNIDPIYFGLFNRPKDTKLIGFSISSNMYSVNFLGKKINDYIQNFNNISFREEQIAYIINKVTSKNFQVTLDPTLCLDAESWNRIINNNWENKKYIVLYHVMLRFSPIIHKMLLKQAERIAKSKKCEIIDLSTGEYTVIDFISAIKYAQCVITTSFHATVFSIIFSRPLFSVKLHDGNDNRYVDLLKSLNMEQALVDLDFEQDTPEKLDYTQIKNKLLEIRKPTLNYLKLNVQ